MDYYSKYLKYKSKYLELQKQAGGKCGLLENKNICELREAGFTQDFLTEKKGATDHNSRINKIKVFTPEEIENIKNLKIIGFDDKDAYKIASDYTTKYVNNIIILKKAGFSHDNARYGRQLTDKEINNMIKLKTLKPEGFDDLYAIESVDFTNEQIENMIKLKNPPNNFDDHYAHKGAQLEDKQIKNMIKLKTNDIGDYHAYEGAHDLKEEKQIENMIKLKQARFDDFYALLGAKSTDAQINKMIELKNSGKTYKDAYYTTLKTITS